MSKDLAVRELERLKLMAGGEIDQDSSRKKKKSLSGQECKHYPEDYSMGTDIEDYSQEKTKTWPDIYLRKFTWQK